MLPIALALASSLPVGPAPSQAPPPFLLPRYRIGEGVSPVAGDLEGDGDGDLAVARGDYVTLLWTHAGRWIERAERLPVEASRLVGADLDGDGDLDLVAAGPTALQVLLGDGLGAFAPTSPVALPGAALDLLAADVDLDDRPDLVVVCSGDPGLALVLLADGQGGLVLSARLPLAPQLLDSAFAAVGDLDGDGHPDLVVNPYQLVFRGDGQGGFVFGGTLGISFVDESFVLADMDGDSDLDLVRGESGWHQLRIHLGDGKGAFPTNVVVDAPMSPVALTACDFEGDGDTDVLAKDPYEFTVGVFVAGGRTCCASRGSSTSGTSPALVDRSCSPTSTGTARGTSSRPTAWTSRSCTATARAGSSCRSACRATAATASSSATWTPTGTATSSRPGAGRRPTWATARAASGRRSSPSGPRGGRWRSVT